MKYVALLRGINIGGRNKIDMKQLVIAMERDGLKEVSTYINTGNIFFTSDEKSSSLEKQLHKVIEDSFGLSIKVLLKSKDDYEKIIKELPDSWQNNSETKSNCMFLWEEYDNPGILDQLEPKVGIDDIRYVPGVLLWKTSNENFNKSDLSRLAGTELYKHMTVRNVNTTRKIWERLES